MARVALDQSTRHIPDCGSVLGIDVGYSPTRRSSAICRLDWDLSTVSLTIERFRAVEPERSETIKRLANRPIHAAAFDGPLRADLGIIGCYRRAEQLLTRGLRPFIGKPGQANAPVGKRLNEHANACARIVIDTATVGASTHEHAIHSTAIAEAFPSSFLGLLIEEPRDLQARRGNRSDIFYVHLVQSGGLFALLHYVLLGRRSVIALEAISNHDDRAAVVCALTALCVAAGNYSAVGDDNGWIILPPPSFVRSWAWPILLANAEEGGFEWRGLQSEQ